MVGRLNELIDEQIKAKDKLSELAGNRAREWSNISRQISSERYALERHKARLAAGNRLRHAITSQYGYEAFSHSFEEFNKSYQILKHTKTFSDEDYAEFEHRLRSLKLQAFRLIKNLNEKK